ncbi:hypothetical protein [Cytobacillus sp. IB215665]|uniref:hypothetical protein n=1 Tax=Cytobacillus sp. IB215665 TaxID=3097357 RepID=UPI002A0E9E55|nr:hypothetical protein [Cytobacillus sp. IB215665]MDX8368019.1 hypothetical protein [Cytobacillus sp. IB215665]
MFLLLILAISFYLYKTGELQKLLSNIPSKRANSTNGLKDVVDYRYASGQISTEEYQKLIELL